MENLTDDHVPPKSFFPPPLPTNLITVRCCEKCNNAFSVDDEAFLIWITSAVQSSEKGRWILINKIVPKLRKKIKLRDNVRKHLRKEKVHLPGGMAELPLSYFPDERGDRFMTRLTKGFIRNFYPHYDYSNDDFHVYCVKPFKENERAVLFDLVHARNLTRDSRGDGVIDFWHGITAEGKGGSLGILFLSFRCLNCSPHSEGN